MDNHAKQIGSRNYITNQKELNRGKNMISIKKDEDKQFIILCYLSFQSGRRSKTLIHSLTTTTRKSTVITVFGKKNGILGYLLLLFLQGCLQSL